MAAKKKKTVIVKLVSTASKFFYVTKKNPKMVSGKKLNKMKYDPVVRKHVMFEEKKIK